MTTMNKFGTVLAMAGVLALGACATTNDPYNTSSSGSTYPSQPVNSGNVYSGYGVVQAIDLVQQGNTGIGGSGIGVGAIAGAVIGGVLGNQVGSGSGRTVATVAGAAGGAYVGNQVEHSQQRTADVYRFTIRMDNGSYQTLTQSSDSGFRVGDRVRLDSSGYLQRG